MTGITKEKFPLPTMESFLGAMRNEILNGKGFILFKGFPVEAWGNYKSAVACKPLQQLTSSYKQADLS